MKIKTWSACLLFSLVAVEPVHAQITKGVMAIRGAEMS